MDKYIQIGTMALRQPGGGFMPAMPIYKAINEDAAEAAENAATDRAAQLFYEKMKRAAAACKKAGIKTRSL